MHFSIGDRIPHPRERAYVAMRDRMVDFVPYLPNVKEIRVLERKDLGGGRLYIVNEWVSDYEVPLAIRPILKPHMLQWIDKVTWDGGSKSWRWEFEYPHFRGALKCSGTNRMRAVSERETEIEIGGDLELDLTRIPGVQGFLGRLLAPRVEKFIVGTITPNLRATDQALARYLEENEA